MKHWPADKVERRAVASLVPYARNARTHSEAQVAQIAASIREWGWTVPVLVDDDGGIIAGHGRVLAADKLGLADVPCMVATDRTDAQKRAYALADNKLALNAGWDDDLLAVELQGLAEWDFDMSLTGFSEDEIADLTIDRTQGLTDPDDVPDVPVAETEFNAAEAVEFGFATEIFEAERLAAHYDPERHHFKTPPSAAFPARLAVARRHLAEMRMRSVSS